MSWFGPSREERYAAAAAALRPYAFVVDRARAAGLRRFLPFDMLTTPARYHVAAIGRIEDTDVLAYEYGYDSTDHEGNPSSHDAMVVAVVHPAIAGRAAFGPDHRAWGGIGAVLDALFWIPPFTVLKVFQYLAESRNPDRVVGHAEFDRLYYVRAASDDVARRVVTPELRDAAVRFALRGTVELHDGALLYSIAQHRFDAEGVVRALGYAAPLLAATALAAQYAYR